jgi:hypothetical protein
MSSSRSIAAARNRRSGDVVQQQQPNRPNTSIGSSSAFSQQPNHKTQQNNFVKSTSNSNSNSNSNSTSNASLNPNVPFSKISVSDAIGLITLRLGKAEQFLIDLQNDGGGLSSSLPENTQLVDSSVLMSIINRLDSIEKKEQQTTQILTRIEKSIADIKNELNSKIDNFVIETNTRFDDVDSAFVLFEQNLQPVQEDIIKDEVNQQDVSTEITPGIELTDAEIIDKSVM